MCFKLSLPSVEKNTRQRSSLSNVKNKTLSKEFLCKVFFYRAFFGWHSAKSFFAECPKKHSINHLILDKELNSGSVFRRMSAKIVSTHTL
jgi:hypothetical protein